MGNSDYITAEFCRRIWIWKEGGNNILPRPIAHTWVNLALSLMEGH